MRYLDTLAHTLLYVGIAAGLVAFFIFKSSTDVQFAVIVATSVFYLLWGVIYHLLKNDLSKKLLIEYTMIALITVGVGFLVFLS
jgi:hypothetical protein